MGKNIYLDGGWWVNEYGFVLSLTKTRKGVGGCRLDPRFKKGNMEVFFKMYTDEEC